METFGGVTIDDLVYCPYEEYGSGTSTQLLYAPSDFFEIIKLPEETEGFEESLTIDEDDVKFKEGLNWATIDILIEENELKTTLDGAVQRKKTRSEVNFFILGFKKKVLGFLEKLKNVPMVFGIKDSEGTIWLLGNLRNRAFLESAEGTTGKKYEDNSGVAAKVTVRSAIYGIMKKTYRVYSATITQSGNDAPIATELENTMGTVYFIYQSAGNYLIQSNAFDNKTVIQSLTFMNISNDTIVTIERDGNKFIMKSTRFSTLIEEDGLIQRPLFIEIRKYQ